MTKRRMRVRTSTFVLAALFVGASILYLFVRPTTTAKRSTPPATSGSNL